MRICVIGNSHVGSLKRAWDLISSEYSSFSLTFFAMGGSSMKDLVVKDGLLVGNNEDLTRSLRFTSGGLDYVNVNDYDVFLVYGMQCTPLIMSNLFYSSALIDSLISDLCIKTTSYKTIIKLNTLTNKPIFVGHNPLESATQLSNVRALEVGSTEAYVAGVAFLNEQVYSKLNCELVIQPLDTIVGGKYTNPKFSKGSRKLATGTKADDLLHDESDIYHMNRYFGEVWLRFFFLRFSRDPFEPNLKDQ